MNWRDGLLHVLVPYSLGHDKAWPSTGIEEMMINEE